MYELESLIDDEVERLYDTADALWDGALDWPGEGDDDEGEEYDWEKDDKLDFYDGDFTLLQNNEAVV